MYTCMHTHMHTVIIIIITTIPIILKVRKLAQKVKA